MSKNSRAARADAIASALGVSLQEFSILRRRLAVAAMGIDPALKGKNARRAATATRLSISEKELIQIRVIMASSAEVGYSPLASATARHLINLPEISTPSRAKRSAGASSPKSGIARGLSNLGADRTVYITPLGHALHLDRDCHGMRGFRRAFQSDPDVQQLALRDRRCAGRLPCQICVDSMNSSRYRELLNLVHTLHGTTRASAKTASTRRSKRARQKQHGRSTAKAKKKSAQLGESSKARLRNDNERRREQNLDAAKARRSARS